MVLHGISFDGLPRYGSVALARSGLDCSPDTTER
jgi:hypothetical protein